MYHPADVDGRHLVILERTSSFVGAGFRVVAAGWLADCGERLVLLDAGDQEIMAITDQHLARMLPVIGENRIAACAGYDLFILVDPDEKSSATPS
jgi:hypothetical protein